MSQQDLVRAFPRLEDVPIDLIKLEDSCGLWAAWGVLKYFEKPISHLDLVRRCHYGEGDGILAVAIALALHCYGLKVRYYTEPDPESSDLEKALLQKAAVLGIGPSASIDLDVLLSRVNTKSVPIVLYNSRTSIPHLSPLLGTTRSKQLILVYGVPMIVPRTEFERQWNGDRIFRTCVIASS